jgi:hypothetical protein
VNGLPVLISAALLLAAALMFVVEPMAGRRVLPLFGGTPAVWTTCMLFFQAGLLAGYSYVHLVTSRLDVRRQAALQVGLVLAALGMLAAQARQPAAHLAPLTSFALHPTAELIGLLLMSVGLPFFVLASMAPLLQRWFATTGHPRAADPYFLYVLSNSGSLLGLLAYPLLLERNLTGTEQERVWFIGFSALAALVLGCGVAVWRSPGPAAAPADRGMPDCERPGSGARLRWIWLAFVPSSLLLSATAALTTDLAPAPLLWIVPLSLYLLSFILAFARRGIVSHALAVRLLPVAVMALVPAIAARLVHPFWIPVHLFTFLVAALVCHGELARRRPGTHALTAYYLAIALGGTLGGVFNALVAPVVFDRVVEYPVGVFGACLCLPGAGAALLRGRLGWLRDALIPGVIGVLVAALVRDVGGLAHSAPGALAVILASGLAVLVTVEARGRPLRFALGVAAVLVSAGLWDGVDGRVVHRQRSFFGVLRVTEFEDGAGRYHRLFQGTTLHGQQCLAPDRRREPLAYYHSSGPIGQVFAALHARPAGDPAQLSVAAVGLGAGSLAAYARAGEHWTFYEIDPAVVRIAREPRLFTYLDESRAGSIRVDVGDARIQVRHAADHGYDLLVLDAFSSDAIPTHLLTREAVRLYRTKLAAGGWIAIHLSNRTIDLDPVVGLLARDAGLAARVRHDRTLTAAERQAGKSPSIWAVLAANASELGTLAHDPRWRPPPVEPGDRVWTDDDSSVVRHLRLGRRLDAEAPTFRFQRPCQQARAGVDGVDVGRRCRREPPELDHRAHQGIELQGAAVLDILEHRGLVLADAFRSGDAPLERDAKAGAELLADGLRLGHHLRCQRPARGETAYPGQRGVRQCADRIEAQVAPELQPDLGPDVGEDRGLEARVLKGFREPLDPGCLGTIELAHRKTVSFDMADDAGGDQLRRRIDHTADDAVDRDRGGDHSARVDGLDPRSLIRAAELLEVPPGDPVLHGHDDRLGAEKAVQLIRHGRELMRLHRRYHEVLHDRFGDPVGRLDGMNHMLGAVLHDEPHALLPDGLEVGATADERDVVASQRELHAEHAADRAGADNTYVHRKYPTCG